MRRSQPDPEDLLAHRDFVRAMAGAVLGADDRVDDVEQETWLAALTHASGVASVRAWLGTVSRNRAYREIRSASRRSVRERGAPHAEQSPDPASILEIEETRRRLLSAVVALGEPYRGALLLRYYEGLRPPQIARRLDVPVETVRTRLRRGLAQLRQRFSNGKTRHGGRGLAALGPLAFESPPPTTSILGGLAVSTTTKVTLAVAAAGLLIVGTWFALGGWERWESPDGRSRNALDAASERLAEAPPELEGRLAQDAETPASPPAVSATAPVPAQAEGIVTGVVRDAQTKAVIANASVRVRMDRGSLTENLAEVRSDAWGCFRIDLRSLRTRSRFVFATAGIGLRVVAARYQPAGAALKALDASSPHGWKPVEIELKHGATVMGRVVDAQGEPVSGAQVAIRRTDVAGRYPNHAWADAEGRFEMGLESGAEYAGHAEGENVGRGVIGRLAVASAARIDLGDLRLLGPGTISGVLRYPNGKPAAFAKAAAWALPAETSAGPRPDPGAGLSTTRARADEMGRFVLRGLSPGRYYVADAAERPRGARRSKAGDWPVHATGTEDVSVLVRVRRVVLRVRDAEGNPLPGADYAVRWGTSNGMESGAGSIQDKDGFLTFRGNPGERIELNVKVTGSGIAEFVVNVREDVWHVQEDIVLRPRPQGVGSLHITALLDEGGRPIETAAVNVTTSKTDALVRYQKPLPEDGRFSDLTPGAYQLEVIPGRKPRGPPAEMWFPVTQAFEIQAGKETALKLRARLGARIRLTVYAEGLKRDPRDDALKALDPAAPDRYLRGMKLFVVRAGSSERLRLGSLLTDRPDGGWSQGRGSPGVPGLAYRLLEAGSYTLHIELEGYRPVSRELRLDAGLVHSVEVTLEGN